MSTATPHNMSDSTVKKLTELIQINEDSVKGIQNSLEATDDQQILTVFRSILQDREKFSEQLRAYVQINDGNDDPTGSLSGFAHRWWLKAHAALSNNEEVTVLKDAEAGEDAIKHKYEDVLKETAGSPVNDVLTRQYEVVKQGHDRIRDLRDSYIAANK